MKQKYFHLTVTISTFKSHLKNRRGVKQNGQSSKETFSANKRLRAVSPKLVKEPCINLQMKLTIDDFGSFF